MWLRRYCTLALMGLMCTYFVRGFQGAGISCKINTGNAILGICKEVGDCPAVLSNLHAGIYPEMCNTGGKDNKLVCCPNTERISRKKCMEYEKILTKEVGPVPLLPLEFLQERQSLPVKSHCKRLPLKLIVGGRDATIEEFPHMAALGYGLKKDQKWLCGGSLISDKFVMTAAHCALSSSEGPIKRVLLGSSQLSSNPRESQVIEVSKIIVHPKYVPPSVYNDIALIELKSRVRLTRSILPACLPQPELRLEKLNVTQVTGWGLVETGGSQSDVLQAVQLSRFSQKQCQNLYDEKLDKQLRYRDGIQRTQFCAGSLDENKDSCNGDSGGPLTVKSKDDSCAYYVAGIVSFGNRFCGIEPGIYTNVQSYLNWIEDTVWPVVSPPLRNVSARF